MTTAGPNLAGAGADDAAIGTVAWGTPGNITADDASYATVTTSASISHYLKASTYGFGAIPNAATINSITIEAKCKATAGTQGFVAVKPYIGGWLTGQSFITCNTTETWQTTAATDWSAQLGRQVIGSDVNTAAFAVGLWTYQNSSDTYSVNAIRVTVVYTTSVSVTPTTASLTTTRFAPTARVNKIFTPSTLALATNRFAPTAPIGKLFTPAAVGLALTGFAPTIVLPRTVTPGLAALVTTAFAPTATVGKNVTIGNATLVTATFAPTVLAPRVAIPGIGALVLTGYAPTARVNKIFTPSTLALTTNRFAPTVTRTLNVLVRPAPASLVLVTFPLVILIPNLGLPRPRPGTARFYGTPGAGSGRFGSVNHGVGRFNRPQPGTGR